MNLDTFAIVNDFVQRYGAPRSPYPDVLMFFGEGSCFVTLALYQNHLREILYKNTIVLPNGIEESRLHRPHQEGPAYTLFNQNGMVVLESYSEHGKRHRPRSDGYATTTWNDDGTIRWQQHWENGLLIYPGTLE